MAMGTGIQSSITMFFYLKTFQMKDRKQCRHGHKLNLTKIIRPLCMSGTVSTSYTCTKCLGSPVIIHNHITNCHSVP